MVEKTTIGGVAPPLFGKDLLLKIAEDLHYACAYQSLNYSNDCNICPYHRTKYTTCFIVETASRIKEEALK